ncbi:hypothetical protein CYY_004926 [Polysphondylium violaceum]|uniref:Lysosomal dipeptide transporter MFSD1 n=1 Tax=Polysphondylium violaceum TaxID=133409 RepID=A0A8J4V4P6_9MYCE|nr:hypothetical protein CYY_004926 [Polysphondylium violaceum]
MATEENEPLTPNEDGSNSPAQKQPLKSHLFRYLGLLFICLITFGSYYIYDIPGAFQTNIEALYNIQSDKFNVLYSVYNFPNTVIVFFGGYLIDSVFGLRKGALIFCCLVMSGQILFAVSGSLKLYWLAVVGRMIFGLGGESLSVAQSTFCATWFNGRSDINFAFAVTLGFSRIGSAVNFQTTPKIAAALNTADAIWFGAITCGVSFVACLILIALDAIRAKKDKSVVKNDPVQLADIKRFPVSLWLIFLAIVLFYVPLFVYVVNAKQFLGTKWPGCDASVLASIPYYTAAPSPIIGFIIDRFGRNLTFMTVASIGMAVAHIILAYTHVTPYVGMIIMGLSYATMAASIWVTFPALVPSKRLGTAYGLAFAFQNAGVAIVTLIIGAILTKTDNNYLYSESIFVGIACVGVAIHIILIFIDLKTKAINIPAADMKALVKRINQEEKPLLINDNNDN